MLLKTERLKVISMVEKLRNNTLIKILIFILCLPLPVVIGTSLFSSNSWNIFPNNNPYVYLSFGFYGCLLACLIWKNRLLKVLMITLNIVPGFFLFLGALMGGIEGIVTLLLIMLLPFIPWIKIL